MAWTTPNSSRPANYKVLSSDWNADQANAQYLYDHIVSPFATCVLSATGNVSCSNATETALTFSTEDLDTDTMHSTSVNTSRITINTSGWYEFCGYANFSNSSATGFRRLVLWKNGVGTGTAVRQCLEIPSTIDVTTSLQWIQQCAGGDYFELGAYQSSGGAENVTNRQFSAKYLGS